MLNQLNQEPSSATEKETPTFNLFGNLTSDMVVVGGTLGLAFLGVAITYVNRDLSYLYWLTRARSLRRLLISQKPGTIVFLYPLWEFLRHCHSTGERKVSREPCPGGHATRL
jgi:hypothetical protein